MTTLQADTEQNSAPPLNLVPPLLGSAIGLVTALVLQRSDAREHLADNVSGAASNAKDALLSAGKQAAPALRSATHAAAETAEGALDAGKNVVGQLADAARPLAHSVAETVGGALSQAADDGKQTAKQARKAGRSLSARAQRKETKRMNTIETGLAAEVTKQLARQEKQLRDLNARLDTLGKMRRQSRGGGFPWGLLLLAGGGYYVYSNKDLRGKIVDFVQNLDPGVKGNLERAGSAAREGFDAVKRGEDPTSAVKDAAGELKAGAQKAVSGAQDKAQDLKQQAQDKAQDVQRDAKQTMAAGEDRARKLGDDVKR